MPAKQKRKTKAAEEPDPWAYEPGGAPEASLEFIRECLEGKAKRRNLEGKQETSPPWVKEAELREIADLLRLVTEQALSGDKESGYFLGEMLAVLPKKSPLLRKKNKAFNKCFAKLKSARPETVRSSDLRPIVSDFISRARMARRDFRRWTAMKRRLPKKIRGSFYLYAG